MKRWLLLLSVVLLTQLGGCAYVSTLGGDLDQRIDQWVAQREYGKALAAIDWVGPDDSRYRALQEKRRLVERLAHTYEKEIIHEADTLVGRGEWAGALKLYDHALDRLPDSAALHEGLNRLNKIQLSRSRELEHDLLMQKGEWLVRAIPVQEQLAEVSPRDRDTQKHLEVLRTQAGEIARQLYRDGIAALKTDEMRRAQSSLSLASQLVDDPEIQTALKDVRSRRARAVRRTQNASERAANEKHRKVVAATVAQYRSALKSGEYVRAQALMGQLETLDGDDPEIQAMRADLDKAVHARVERYLQDGATAYSLGNFEQALGLWAKALALEPDNARVRERTERARRVLHNVRELRQKQLDD